MANFTVARPYAKALFEYALETKALETWSQVLSVLAQVVLDESVSAFLSNPSSTEGQQKELLLSPFSQKLKVYDAVVRWVDVLVSKERALALPLINQQFQDLCAEHEKTLVVQVRSFSPLSKKQEQALIDRLSERLQRRVSLEVSIDPSLLGGAVIQAGDFVIDGSVREKLHALRTELVA